MYVSFIVHSKLTKNRVNKLYLVPGLSLLETERKDKRKREIDEEAGGEKDIAREQEKKKRKIHHSPLRLSISKIGCKPRRREEGGFWGQYIWGWDGDFESEKYGERTEIVIETETETEAFPLLGKIHLLFSLIVNHSLSNVQ